MTIRRIIDYLCRASRPEQPQKMNWSAQTPSAFSEGYDSVTTDSHISELLSRMPIAGASTRDSLFVLIRIRL